MKPIRLLTIFGFALFLTFNNVNGQNQISVNTIFQMELDQFQSPGMDETASGFVEAKLVLWTNGNVLVTWNGVLTGVSGDEYRIHFVSKGNHPDYPNLYTLVGEMIVWKGNKLLAKSHETYHITVNTNGEIISLVDNYGWMIK